MFDRIKHTWSKLWSKDPCEPGYYVTQLTIEEMAGTTVIVNPERYNHHQWSNMATPTSMTWTTDKPTKEGWYWYREPAAPDERKLPRIIDVRMVDDELWTLSHLNRWGEYDGPYTSSGRPCDMFGQWYGPIEPPTE